MEGEILVRISTNWPLLFQAQLDGDAAQVARQELLLRYREAVYRYLCTLVKDPAEAEILTQEFALKFAANKLTKGKERQHRRRFRDYVKRTVFTMAMDWWRKRLKQTDQPLPEGGPPTADETNDKFEDELREELLANTWKVLQQKAPHQHAVLRFYGEHRETMHVQDMVQPLLEHLSGERNRNNLSDMIRRAKEHFADLLVHEVACSLWPLPKEASPREEVLNELRALRLLDYCRSAVTKQGWLSIPDSLPSNASEGQDG